MNAIRHAATLNDGANPFRVGDVVEPICIEQDQVGHFTGSNNAERVSQHQEARAINRRGAKRLGGREPRVDE
ncbi:MAG: hypothetical protein NVSMB53_16260 [Gemmatimonadaceae bacterium]